jgi:two-component system, sensor histidine kinase
MDLTVDLNYIKFIKETFPFHIYIDQNFKIIGAGESLLKILPIELHNDFSNFFHFLRPFSVETKYNSVLEFNKQLFIIKSNINAHLLLRGQMIPMRNNCLLFIGSPWINNIETIGNLGLTLNDFALHDSTTDLLHLLKTKDIVSADLESVTKIVREQNQKLIDKNESLKKLVLSIDDIIIEISDEMVFKNAWAKDEKKLFLEKDIFLNKKISEVFNNSLGVEIAKNVLHVLTHDQKSEFEYQDPSGKYWFSAVFNPFENQGQKSVLVTIRNITEKKLFQEDILLAKKKAEDLANSKDVFLANISHELRNPINIISGLADLISRENISSKALDYVSKISSASQTLLTLVNDVLEYENINSGNLKLHKSIFSFDKEILDFLSSYKLSEANNNILVTNIPSKNLGNFISDKNRIKQVLTNLLSNADKFTKNGTITITISHRKVIKNKYLIKISIKDTGIGIKKSEQKKVFERFARSKEIENNISGTGLGLSIVKNIVNLLNGKITLISAPKKGSEFILEIPIEKESRRSVSSKNKSKRIGISKLNVLIVDDDEINRIILENILSRNHINVVSTSNGKKALNVIDKTHIDIVFLDLQMPIMDGFECISNIRKHKDFYKRSTTVFALSANVFADKRNSLVNYGFSGFIHKPYDEKKIIDSINNTVNESLKYKESLNALLNGNSNLIASTFTSLSIQIIEFLELIKLENNLKFINEVYERLHKISPSLFYINEVKLAKLIKATEENIKNNNVDSEEIINNLNKIGHQLVRVLGHLNIIRNV